MRENCTSGSVRGEGGNILTYSACGFDDLATFVQMMKSSIGIGLQNTRKGAQMLLGMFSLAVLCVGEPDSWRHITARWSIVAEENQFCLRDLRCTPWGRPRAPPVRIFKAFFCSAAFRRWGLLPDRW